MLNRSAASLNIQVNDNALWGTSATAVKSPWRYLSTEKKLTADKIFQINDSGSFHACHPSLPFGTQAARLHFD